MNVLVLFFTLLVGLFIIIGTICGLNCNDNKKITDLSISIALGVVLSLILFELIPESFEILSEQIGVFRSILSILILALIGVVFLRLIDMFIPHHEHEAHHHHEHTNEKCHDEHLYHIGIISSVAIIIHNLIEGMSLYLVSLESMTSGLLMCIGVGLHNIPMGLVIASTLISSGYSKEKTLKISFIVSISTFLGGLIMFLLGGVNELVEEIMLGLTTGMLIHIGVFELLHQVYHMQNKKIARTGVLIGALLLIVSVVMEHLVG